MKIETIDLSVLTNWVRLLADFLSKLKYLTNIKYE
ncbi:hypothetical protein Xbud_03232 [Xenorhabdus budapestensis]|uniref:Uncharacterized protein n=1 Tax=Xenorhabdus budapestensis TaxID=290110 RepID=A0A2D0ISB0_XENBU|nr:hypothetical protein Xbud_03232 [Xenorhabdus budapestensis]